MKHLKLFETEVQYESFKYSADFVLPNVSLIGKDVVMYNPLTEPISSYTMVDLGLPSGLKWADRNIGASSPEDYGLYFQWGDLVGYTAEQVINGEKSFSSDFSDYFDTTDGGSTFNKYAKNKLTFLEASNDAAAVHMGSEWRMPTEAEMQELVYNTTPTFIDIQGNEYPKDNVLIELGDFKGIKFTGSNGNSIFIPAAGSCYDSVLHAVAAGGSLWTSDLNLSGSDRSWHLSFNNRGRINIISDSRFHGFSVRGVHA